MSAEKTMRKRVVAALRSLHAVPVENGCGLGTPDVAYVEGWLELKSMPEWPARPETALRIEHFTQDQRVWLLMHARCGGAAWLLLKVADDWLLFTPEVAAAVVGRDGGTREKLISCAHRAWLGGLDEAQLLEVLQCRNRQATTST